MDGQLNDWLRLEFRENFTQLRDRDAQIMGMTKFLATLILSVATVVVGLLGLEQFTGQAKWIGLLLIAASVVGEILFLWIATFREYFVVCARQLNAIRSWYVRRLPLGEQRVAVQPIDSRFPRVFNPRSAQTAIWTMILVLVATTGSIGVASLLRGLGVDWNWVVMGVVDVVSAVFILNFRHIRKRSQGRRAIVVDVDNTLLTDVPRKQAILRESFGKQIDNTALAGNYYLKGILNDEEMAEFRRQFLSGKHSELDQVVPGSPEVLDRAAKSVRVIYLTGRPEYMREATEEKLRKEGFPLPAGGSSDYLVMKPSVSLEETRHWKTRVLLSLIRSYEIVAAVGDAPGDCEAYVDVGLRAICLHSYWRPEEVRAAIGNKSYRVAFVEDWADAEQELRSLVGGRA